MNFHLAAFILFTGILAVGMQAAHAAQLDTIVDPNEDSSLFKMTYQKTIFIEYDDGGQIADLLQGHTWEVTTESSTPSADATVLMNELNQKIASDTSGARISDLTVSYLAVMTGRESSASIDYKIVLNGTLTDYNIAAEGGLTGQKLVDMGWRGMTVTGPVTINGMEINIPISPIAANEDEVYQLMRGTDAETLLSTPLIDAEGIKNQPLTNWHFLFDPAGIGVDAGTFGLSDQIKGFVVSGFTMGESGLREGRQVEREFHAEFTLDRAYGVRTVQSADTANLDVIGFAAIDNLAGLEIVGVTPTAPEGYGTTSTGDFPVAIIYGMAGLAAVGGGAFFVFSSRQLKKEEGQGQTGIDPSRLTGYQTSASAGGYQTNRGEAQLTDDSDYNKTRSVYDDHETQQRLQIAPPSETDATCGCASSTASGNECDCQMQSHCLCDLSCGCSLVICMDAVKNM